MHLNLEGKFEDYDELVDLRTLAHHYLGPEPSHFVLCAIRREEESKFIITESIGVLIFTFFLLK